MMGVWSCYCRASWYNLMSCSCWMSIDSTTNLTYGNRMNRLSLIALSLSEWTCWWCNNSYCSPFSIQMTCRWIMNSFSYDTTLNMTRWIWKPYKLIEVLAMRYRRWLYALNCYRWWTCTGKRMKWFYWMRWWWNVMSSHRLFCRSTLVWLSLILPNNLFLS